MDWVNNKLSCLTTCSLPAICNIFFYYLGSGAIAAVAATAGGGKIIDLVDMNSMINYQLQIILQVCGITTLFCCLGITHSHDSQPAITGLGAVCLWSVACLSAFTVAAVALAPVALGAAGFTAAGITAGSYAASMMSAAALANGGGVAAGSAVALLQPAGKYEESYNLMMKQRKTMGCFDVASY